MEISEQFRQMANDESGTIYKDGYENGVRYLIMRGPASLCAYVGVPLDHPLAGFGYDKVPLDCHGGLTFSSEGEGNYPAGWYWYGWDYAHSGDVPFYDIDPSIGLNRISDDTAWTIDMVQEEIWWATYHFAKLKSIAEEIASK